MFVLLCALEEAGPGESTIQIQRINIIVNSIIMIRTVLQISRVFYPGLPSHPQHEVAKKQMSSFGGMIVFEVAGGLQPAKTLVEVRRI